MVDTDLAKGFSATQVAQKHGWPEPLVWSFALQEKDDFERFKELNWDLLPWDYWKWNDCDTRFGDGWPERIPAQLIGHILYYFSNQNDLVYDPMSGGGVTADTCLAFGRKCWSMDMIDRPDARPEIEPYWWDIKGNFNSEGKGKVDAWLFNAKEKPDLIIFDPPAFGSSMAKDHPQKSISALPKREYLAFLERFFSLMGQYAKKTTTLAFIIADWRDFENKSAVDECVEDSLLVIDYLALLNKAGWQHTHVIQAPMSSERFEEARVLSAMQKKKSLGVTSRHVIISKQII